jgi:hypothetical protein
VRDRCSLMIYKTEESKTLELMGIVLAREL